MILKVLKIVKKRNNNFSISKVLINLDKQQNNNKISYSNNNKILLLGILITLYSNSYQNSITIYSNSSNNYSNNNKIVKMGMNKTKIKIKLKNIKN